jgi:hypothetical protein
LPETIEDVCKAAARTKCVSDLLDEPTTIGLLGIFAIQASAVPAPKQLSNLVSVLVRQNAQHRQCDFTEISHSFSPCFGREETFG